MTLLQLAPLLPLKRIAAIRSSNVDKVVKDNEIPIRLCNYVDVYYNDQIHPALEFAAGSAKQSEIDRFGLRPGDVLITKDSETPDDIAVPALVVQGADDLVCGYHLALLRPNPSRLNGKFLFYALKSRSLQAAFSVLAQGITRFGLTLSGIGSVAIPLPDLPVQKAIADFLHRETARIDQLIEKKQRMVEVLGEKRQAVISRAVTKGLDPSVRMKESCVEWIGALPESSGVRRGKFMFREGNARSKTGGEELLSVSHVTGVTRRSEKNVYMFLAESNENYKLVTTGDVVVNTMWAWMGAIGVSPIDGLVSPSYGVYAPTGNHYLPQYLELLLRSRPFVAEVNRRSKGVWSSRLRLYPDAFLDISFPVPSREDQARTLSALTYATKRESTLGELGARSIDRLREFRSALITAAVTGQIDVSTWSNHGTSDRRLDQIEEATSA